MATAFDFSIQSDPAAALDSEHDLKPHCAGEDTAVYLATKESSIASSRSSEVDDISESESLDEYPTAAADSVTRYFRRLEERVKDLENQIAKLMGSDERSGRPISAAGLGAGQKLPHSEKYPYSSRPLDSLGVPRSRTSTTANPEPLRMDRAEFESSIEVDPIHAIELLVEPTPPPSSSTIEPDGGISNPVLRMRIRSEQLLRSLHDVIGPALFPETFQSVVILRPFKVLILHQVELQKKMESLEYQVLKGDVSDSGKRDSIITTLSPDPARLYLQLRSLLDILNKVMEANSINMSKDAPVVSFIGLWHLFPPGDNVICRDGDTTNAFRIRSVRGGGLQTKANEDGNTTEIISNSFILDCFYLDYNGKRLGPIQREFTIHHFLGEREVLKLPVVPASVLHSSKNIHQLVERGRKFHNLSKRPLHQFYSGLSLDSIAEEVDGNVVVDSALYYRQNPHTAPVIGLPEYVEPSHDKALLAIPGMCRIKNCICGQWVIKNGIYDDRKVDKALTTRFLDSHANMLEIDEYKDGDEDSVILTEDQLMLLPSLVWGFELRKRKWYPLNTSLLLDVRFAPDTFDDLVLPEGHKQVLASLVSTFHETSGKANDKSVVDTVTSKGNGLIILLHGGPGVGKTSTAEGLAEYSRRPLLPITSADLGQTAHEVEQNLETFFSLSQRWDCVLLFDEADILLQARDRTNLQRNAIVSIFLRILEYYTGIIIMTTNRVGTFDEAFKSRIHVVLHFPPLTLESSLQIWETCFHRLRKQNHRIKIDPQIMDYLQHSFVQQGGKLPNGRNIRNAVQSAVALAEYEHKSSGGGTKMVYMKIRHIEAILDLEKKFDQYMYAVYGGTDDIRAKRMGDRNDDDWDRPKYVSRAAAKPKQSYTTSRQGERLSESRRHSASLASLDSD